MICPHCSATVRIPLFTVRMDGAYSCAACGKRCYSVPTKVVDPVSMFLVFGYIAAYVVLQVVAARSGSLVFLVTAPFIGIGGMFLLMTFLMRRTRKRVYAVAELPPGELSRRQRFTIGLLIYMYATLCAMLLNWLDMYEDIGAIIQIVGSFTFIVIALKSWPRAYPRNTFAEE